MRPYITILTSTTRVGGLDVLFETLEAQKFKGFELILNDSLYYHRKDLVDKQSKNYSFPIKHLHQLETATDMCKSVNNALIRAQGTIVYFLPDYTWLDENCLQVHADFHKNKSPKDNKYSLVGHFWDCALPKLHKDFYRPYACTEIFYREDEEHKFEKQEREKFNEYMEDISSGKLNKLMWSLFETPITTSNKPTSFEVTIPKEILPFGPANDRQFVHKNESHLLETLLDINGFNEKLDGSHGWQDWCSTSRIVNTTGTKLYHNPEAIAYTFNPRQIMYARYRRAGVFRNEKVWQDEVDSNFKPINTWSLREARKFLGTDK